MRVSVARCSRCGRLWGAWSPHITWSTEAPSSDAGGSPAFARITSGVHEQDSRAADGRDRGEDGWVTIGGRTAAPEDVVEALPFACGLVGRHRHFSMGRCQLSEGCLSARRETWRQLRNDIPQTFTGAPPGVRDLPRPCGTSSPAPGARSRAREWHVRRERHFSDVISR